MESSLSFSSRRSNLPGGWDLELTLPENTWRWQGKHQQYFHNNSFICQFSTASPGPGHSDICPLSLYYRSIQIILCSSILTTENTKQILTNTYNRDRLSSKQSMLRKDNRLMFLTLPTNLNIDNFSVPPPFLLKSKPSPKPLPHNRVWQNCMSDNIFNN